jgi:hypothetical protein
VTFFSCCLGTGTAATSMDSSTDIVSSQAQVFHTAESIVTHDAIYSKLLMAATGTLSFSKCSTQQLQQLCSWTFLWHRGGIEFSQKIVYLLRNRDMALCCADDRGLWFGFRNFNRYLLWDWYNSLTAYNTGKNLRVFYHSCLFISIFECTTWG